jgi:hypothetical protein
MTKTMTKTETTATVAPRLTVSRATADRWADIATRLTDLVAAVTAARPAAGSYRDAVAWERDRTAIDSRLDVLAKLERRFASEAARMAEAT